MDVIPLDGWIVLVFSRNLGVFWFFGKHKMLQQAHVWCPVCPSALNVVPEWLFLFQPAFCTIAVIHTPKNTKKHQTTPEKQWKAWILAKKRRFLPYDGWRDG